MHLEIALAEVTFKLLKMEYLQYTLILIVKVNLPSNCTLKKRDLAYVGF
jgi:hypothetical protein